MILNLKHFVNNFIIYIMKITDWDNGEIVRVLVARNKISQKRLIEMLKNYTKEEIPQSTFANRIFRNSMRLREMQQICEVLGYDLIIEPRKDS